jgi:hypothetical protein
MSQEKVDVVREIYRGYGFANWRAPDRLWISAL